MPLKTATGQRWRCDAAIRVSLIVPMEEIPSGMFRSSPSVLRSPPVPRKGHLTIKLTLVPLMLVLVHSAAAAQQSRELNAHEHGHSNVNIAFGDTEVAIELEAPGADIVGFEYEAETPEDRARIEDVIAELSRPLALFVMPEAARCTLVEASTHLVSGDRTGAHDHGEDHAGHEHDDEGGTQGRQARHTEFRAEYLLTCNDPKLIDRIDFAFFETFPNAEKVVVRIVSEAGSQRFEISRENPTLDLGEQI